MKTKNVKLKTENLFVKCKNSVGVVTLIFFVFSFWVLCFMIYVLPAHAAAGINRQINFQGKLVDASGLNVADGNYTVVFSLYSVSSGGTAIWTETDSVTTSNGIFQVALGATTPLPDTVYFNSDSLYLGIKVGTDAEMTPRIRFTAVPYAINSASLDGVVATQSATGFTMQGGTSTQSTLAVTTSGGALTFQPGVAEGLTIESNGANGLTLDTGGNGAVTIGNTNATSVVFGNTGYNPTYTFNGTGLTTLGGGLTVDGSTISLANASSSTIQTTGTNAGLTLVANGTGNITLGQNAGNGTVLIQPNAGGQAGLILSDQGNGDLFTASAGASTKFSISNSGVLSLAGKEYIDDSSTANTLILGSSGTNGGVMRVPVTNSSSLESSVGAAGDMYYNASTSEFRCYQGTGWQNCIPAVNFQSTQASTTLTLTTAEQSLLSGTLTPSSTTGEIWINFTGTLNGDSNSSRNVTIRIRRGPCTTGTQVGVDQIVTTNTNGGSYTAAVNYVDLPGVTSPTTYNVCAFTNTGSPTFTGRGMSLYEPTGSAASTGLGSLTVQSSDTASSVTGVSTLQFGPATTSSDQFIITNQTGGVARVTLGNQVGLLNAAATATGVWNFSGGLGVGTASPVGMLDVQGNSATSPVASLSATTTAAGLVINNNGTGDILSASSSGVSHFTIQNNGAIVDSNYTQGGGLLYTNSTGIFNQLADVASGSCLTSAGAGSVPQWANCSTLGTNYLQLNSGALSPFSNTADFLIGGTATTSAKFAFTGVAGSGTPVASISAQNGTAPSGISLSPGSIQSLNMNTLTLGGITTGNVVIDSGSNVTQLADNTVQLTGTAPTISSTNTLTINAFTLGGNISAATKNISNVGALDFGTGNLSFSGNTITSGATLTLSGATTVSDTGLANLTTAAGLTLGSTTSLTLGGTATAIGGTAAGSSLTLESTSGAGNGDFIAFRTGNQAQRMVIDTKGNVGINATTPLATLDIRGNSATTPAASVSANSNFAALVVDNKGAGDLFTASSSGLTRFVITQNGNVGIGTAIPTQTLDVNGNARIDTLTASNGVLYTDNTGLVKQATTGSNGLCLVSSSSSFIPSWGSCSGTASTTWSTLTNPAPATNLTLQMGTDLSTFNWATGTGSNNLFSLTTDASANGTGALLNLATGTGSTIAPLNISAAGKQAFYVTSAGTIGVGTTAVGNGELVVNQANAAGDIFSASQSGNTKFVISNGGNVGIGTTAPTATLDVAGTASVGGQLTFRSGTAQIQSTASQILTIGGSTTGDIALSPGNGTGAVAINANATTGITINGTAGLSVTCPSGDALNGIVTVDGFVTAGTCAVNSHDIAEEYFSSQALQPGDVVATDPNATQSATVIRTTSAYAQNTLGVISTHPQTVLGGNEGGYPVALVGRIPVKVTLDEGSIAVGDYITSSSTEGFGMKATVPGRTVGTALESTTNWNEANCPVVSSIASIVWPADDGSNAAHPCFRVVAPDGHIQYVGKIMVFANLTYSNPEVSVPVSGNYDLLKNTDLSTFDKQNNTASTSGILNAAYRIQTGAGIAVDSTAVFSQATIANIQAGAIVAKQISTDQLNVTTDRIMLGGQTLHDYIAGIVSEVISKQHIQPRVITVSVDGLTTASASAALMQHLLSQNELPATASALTVTGVLGANTINTKHIEGLVDLKAANVNAASISAQTITADTINAKHISGLDILTDGLQKDDKQIAALESLVATNSAIQSAPTEIPATPTAGLSVFQNTVTDATVSGDLRVRGNSLVEGVLHVVDTLFANNFIVNGISDFFGKVIFHNDITITGRTTVGSDTAGIAFITKGSDHVDVTFTKPYDQLPVVNASISLNPLTPTPGETATAQQQRQNDLEKMLLSDNISFIITNKSTKGFTILLNKPADEDIAFSWLALAVQNPAIFSSGTSQHDPSPTIGLSPSPIDSLIPTKAASTSAGF